MTDALKIKFWGVRGSYPAPGPRTVKYGGNTACVEVRAGNKTLILDAGTGIIPLGRDLARRIAAQKRSLDVMLLFSHLHHDHTQGFPFFVPAYLPNARLHIFGPGLSPEVLETVLENNQSPTTFPVELSEMPSAKHIRSVRETVVIVWDETGVHLAEAGKKFSDDSLVIHIHKSYAHPGRVYVYRVEWRDQSIVYATDTEGYVGTDRRLVDFARGADLLIHDAQYVEEHYHGQLTGFSATQGYGHSTVTMACEVATASESGRLVLFHHDPAYDDKQVEKNERVARKRFSETLAAYEELEVTLTPKSEASPTPLPVGEGRGVREEGRVQYVENG